MTPIVDIPSLCIPSRLPSPRSRRARRHTCGLTPRLAPVIGLALVVATVGCGEDATSPTAPETGPALDITPAQALAFRQLSAGDRHTCGVNPFGRAFCWGANSSGQLGDGTTTTKLRPVRVAGGFRFSQVAAGGTHTCGVTPDNRAYCWGGNEFGELGDGTTIRRLTPVQVAGGLRFRQVSVGGPGAQYTCGVTTGNRAYCWGRNDLGQLGNGTNTGPETCVAGRACSTRPVAVVGGLRFRQLSGGRTHTCGVTTDDRAHCWGFNIRGQLGDGTTIRRLRPIAVAGGRQFIRVTAGDNHSCAVNPFDLAFCWGDNDFGQLGDGTTTQRLTPVRVAGGLEFSQIDAGLAHTCGVTTGDRAFCWGINTDGQLGDGTTSNRLTPGAVAGATAVAVRTASTRPTVTSNQVGVDEPNGVAEPE